MMNTEEAICILKNTIIPPDLTRAREAIDMAISALENQRELQVGDEVSFGGPNGVVTRIYQVGEDHEEWCTLMYENGNMSSASAANVRRCRTGKHYPEIREVQKMLGRNIQVNCRKAEWDSNGCLGYSHVNDDEPIELCKHCDKYTGYEAEKQDDAES